MSLYAQYFLKTGKIEAEGQGSALYMQSRAAHLRRWPVIGDGAAVGPADGIAICAPAGGRSTMQHGLVTDDGDVGMQICLETEV